MPTSPPTVTYRSRGALLLYGAVEAVQAALPLLPPGLKTLAVVAGPGRVQAPAGQRTTVVPGTLIQLRGHLGCFRAAAAGPEGPLDLAPLSPNADGLFDLVLDLYERPLFEREVPPPGYLRTGGAIQALKGRIEHLARQMGGLDKPRYYDFDAARCAHDRQGLPGCRRCLDACPAEAIHAEGDAQSGARTDVRPGGIVIDPYLCQGCGSCTLVCPDGAIRYTQPRPGATLAAIAKILAGQEMPSLQGMASLDAAGAAAPAPVLAIHAGAAPPTGIPAGVPSLAVSALGSVGIELWFAALALGASRVVLVRSGELPPTTARLLEGQVALARELLAACGEAPERIRLVGEAPGDQLGGIDWAGIPNPWPAADPAALATVRGKRPLLLAALARITPAAEDAPPTHTLEPGAPFGALGLDAPRCTLCHACVRLCPSGALSNPDGALTFSEAACTQCGLCAAACPERALRLIPRFAPSALFGPRQPPSGGWVTTLKAASEQARCLECGAPFAPLSLVQGSLNHVRNHPMFQGDGLRLLQMCMNCRQKAVVGLGNPQRGGQRDGLSGAAIMPPSLQREETP